MADGENALPTTALVVELLVVGAAALATLVVVAIDVFGTGWVPSTETLSSVFALFPTIAAAYALGVVVDRIADKAFSPRARKLRAAAGFATTDDFGKARAAAYKSDLRTIFEYNRSRLRICRGIALSAACATVAGEVAIWTQLHADEPRVKLTIALAVLGVLFTGMCVYSWKSIVESESKHLKLQGFG